MIVGKAIYYLLTNATDVTDIVSTRIYPEIAQQDADLPYIVYNVANNEPTDTKPEPSKLDTAQVEVNIYSDSYRVVIDLAVAVRAALDRVKGTYAGVNVQSIQYLNEIIDFDEPQRAYNISADYDVRISRTDFEIAQGSPITGVQLGELSDVDVDGVTNGQLIAYNSTSGNWEAADDATGNNTLTGLTDTSITTPADRESLIYDSGNWVNDNLTKSDVGLGNVDNTSDADKPISSATQTALNAKADTSAVPTELNDLSDVTITGTPSANEALIFDTATSSFKSLPNFTNRFEDDAENNKPATPFVERVYTVKADGDGIFIDAQSDTPSSGKVIVRKIYQKAGFLESGDAIGDFTLIHTFADDTAYSATESTFEGFRDGDTYGTPPFTLLQTWEEATAAPAFTGLLNESYGSGAAAAYSVRRLNGNYTGAAIQVERSSDNTTQDIGFDSNGDLDESALTTFCTGTTCKVRSWYDQSQTGGTGSGNDAVQTTHANQPTIYTGGAIVKENGRVAVDFDGTNDSLLIGSDISAASNYAFIWVQKRTTANGWLFDAQTGRLIVSSGSNNLYHYGAWSGTAPSSTTHNLNFLSLVSPSSGNYFENGTNTQSALNYSQIAIGGTTRIGNQYTGSGKPMNGTLQELIIFSSDKSTDRTSIESNIGDYFTQNTPLLDTYTGAAAAYSLRKLRSAFSGSAIRVRRSNDNAETDIGFNVFGELDTVSLAAHCGSNDGFVKTWYDQSGNANDALQSTTTNQPKIYDGTSGVVTENGKPALEFTSDFFLTNNELNQSSATNHFYIVNKTGAGTFGNNYFSESSAIDGNGSPAITQQNVGDNYYLRAASSNVYLGNLTTIKGNQAMFTAEVSNTTSKVYFQGSELASVSSTGVDAITDKLYIGLRWTGADSFKGTYQEFVLYNSDQSSNRTNIESNINTFYSIF